MAEVAPAPAAVPAKVPKKKSSSKVKRQGLSVSEQIVNAISGSKERNGVSLAALKKQLATGGYNVEKNNSRVKFAVRGLVSKGILIQATGTGASGSFKLNKKHTDAKKSVKKSTPKVKKSVTKKSTTTKKVTAKKSDAKKSPRKAKKPAPKKVTKKSRKSVTPKKTMKTTKKVRVAKPKTVKSKAKKK